MHSKREDIPAFQSGPAYSRDAEWGAMNVAFEAFPAGLDTTPLFKGRIRVKSADHEDVITAGEAYYLPPGHNVVVEEDCEILELSPRGEYQKTMEVAARNMAAMQPGG